MFLFSFRSGVGLCFDLSARILEGGEFLQVGNLKLSSVKGFSEVNSCEALSLLEVIL